MFEYFLHGKYFKARQFLFFFLFLSTSARIWTTNNISLKNRIQRDKVAEQLWANLALIAHFKAHIDIKV